ncbi:glycine--tRNA ligase subunit beta [Aliivibrio fischeri]|uniref:Glycine--tRNA ligase beta subunit n=1 Tax=Aliivibrio fischeri (strain ATCC 700601 / ES114) TaxID=312309 RepID=SYGB_ALIF1|nr:glycine--tRNA ligase subunit beta [Aliivibrio fischeri]Q5E8Y5.1 RecName: Full=Glycine--tRNA ligase beta subunit; AltName: Full=Glycyl-tRNA synthetase beta subunit; Short=GlyRS [Aliivibrio fischeri ES114]AAW84511.1 glycyl-tRNA synthetase, beta subunit [Aliivibrio fischeri ES114]KLU79030.1 glycine-tRNA synthetase subunit beta [Aliivibrio fischeri]MBP3140514.1 glycine--tRNA ligase subunit beta [Aliivibrio fischeri]MBP3156168.1 glycine--tRNA ligase subunit beta [Aliivibrio fischeri]MCE7566453.
MAKNFLIELGTEELPPTALRSLAEAFASNFEAELKAADLAHQGVKWYATPRRLALKVAELAESQADKVVEKRGPAVSAAFDADGNPTKAAQGWARGNGITVEQADRLKTDKGEWLLHKEEVKGKPVQELVVDFAAKALAGLPIPKAMRWGNSDIQFIRPVKTLTILLGDELIEGSILGVSSARTLRGHRFMGESEFTIDSADQYPAILEERGKVMADYDARKAIILADSEKAAAAVGGKADLEDDLVEEVTSLVEWPVVLTAKFEEEFLKVPSEALVYTMKGDQKYFPVYDENKKLLPNFIFVSNIESKEPRHVIEGNEKVVRPRLADAEFFFNTDRKRPLIDRLPELEQAIFQKQLGTIKDKTDRITELAGYIAEQIGADVEKSQRAGLLAKCDLMTSMVFEFTDTQGVMGMHYATHDGEDEQVALALYEQYMPRFAGDDLPSTDISSAVAMADKLDTLVGIFGIGQAPKGSDPFALRRAALGVLRIIVEKEYNLDLVDLVAKAQSLFGDKLSNANVATDVIDFMLGRFRAWYQDEGFSVDIIQAVLARRPTKPADFDKRVKAVSHFRELDAAESLAAANKRVGNILAKFDGELAQEIDLALLQEDAEKALAEKVEILAEALEPVFAAGNYQEALSRLAELREPVDAFFDNVMVMADDEALKTNRLTLLNKLRNLFLDIADISLLQK